MLKKFIIIILIFALSSAALAFDLPDEFNVNDITWRKSSESVKNLDASYSSAKFGVWLNKIYRANNVNLSLELIEPGENNIGQGSISIKALAAEYEKFIKK